MDLTTHTVTQKGAYNFSVPWPSGNVRHISDLKVDPSGTLYITAATDNGDDGPFTSAVYVADNFTWEANQLSYHPNYWLFPLQRFDHHKIEGIELVPGGGGGIIVGTDDENMGSSIAGRCY